MTATATPGREELAIEVMNVRRRIHGLDDLDLAMLRRIKRDAGINEAFAIADALLARLADKPDDDGWQDISTAPKDGTRILATGGGLGNEIEIVNYNERVGCWDAPNDTLDDRDDEPQGYNRPTLWQPLPARSSTTGEPKR